jgi:hypothetical protein
MMAWSPRSASRGSAAGSASWRTASSNGSTVTDTKSRSQARATDDGAATIRSDYLAIVVER